jgi:predicted DNA-binding WGR domain protein
MRAEPVAAPKKSAAKRSAKKPVPRAAVDEALLEALKKPLTKSELRPLFEPLVHARALPPDARGITFVAAVAKKSKDTLPIAMIRALGAALTRTGTAKQRQRLANKALDGMRGVSQWDYLSVAPEILLLAEIAGTDRFDRALRFYESADLALDGLIEKLLTRAAERGDETLALRQLAAHAPAVRPIVTALRDPSASPEDKRAAIARAEALASDARIVFDQLLCGTADRENDLVWPSLSRLLAAPAEQHVHRSSLRNALATLRFVEGIEPLLERAAALPIARERLASLIDNESSEYALELVLRALRTHAGDAAVFARVLKAFESPGRAAGELSSEWFRDKRSGAWAYIDDEQAAAVVDAMIAADRAGVSEAHHALYYVSHPGCEARVREELLRIHAAKEATKQDNELYWSLVFALGHIGTDSAVELVRKLAFEATDDGVWECCSVLAATLSEARFESHLAAACAQKAPHAALSVLCTVCTDFIEKGALAAERDRLLVELARVTAMSDGKRSAYAAHVLIEGVAAALRTLSADVVVELSAALGLENAPTKTKSLPATASRFCELRKDEYSSPFDADGGKKLLQRWAEALDGTLLARVSATRHGPIEGALTDGVIEAIAGSPVSVGLVAGDDQRWFVGEDQKMHVVDRSGAHTEGARLVGVSDVPAPHLAASKGMDERACLFDGRNFIEAQRYAESVFVFVGPGVTPLRRDVLRFRSEREAIVALAALRAFAPAGYAELSDPWHVDGVGGVARYYQRKLDDGELESVSLHVVGFDDEDDRRTRAVLEEARILREGGTLDTIKCLDTLKRARDRSVHEWLVDRVRDDDRDAAWHLEALADAQRAIAQTGLAIDMHITVGPPASEASIAALARACSVPAALVACWKSVGSAGFRLGDLTGRFLSPDEVLASRRAWTEALDPDGDPRLATSWPLVLIEQGGVSAVEAVFDGAATGGGARQFTSVSDALWWEESLAWILATGLLAIFARAVIEQQPALAVACFGSRAVELETTSLEHPSKKWWTLVRVDRALGISYGRLPRSANRGTIDRKLFANSALAKSAAETAVSAKRKQGYKG